MKNIINKFWKIPRIYNSKERSASLLELFFDIIVVVLLGLSSEAITEIFIEYVHEHIFHYEKLLFTLFQTITIIFVWRSFTLYSSRYEKRDIRHRLLTFLLMIFLSLMIISINIEPEDEYAKQLFQWTNSIGVLGMSFMLFYINFTVYLKSKCKYEKKARMIESFGRLIHFVISLIIFIIFTFTNSDFFVYVFMATWGISLIIWIFFDYISMSNKIYANTKGILRDHIQERYSILFIIFIGEMLIQTITSISQKDNTRLINEIGHLIASFSILFSWWWIFNEYYNYPDLINRPKRIFIYTYGMSGVLLSLLFSGVSFNLIFSETNDIRKWGKIFLGIGTGMWCLFSSIISFSLRRYKAQEKWIQPKFINWLFHLMFIFWWTWSWPLFINSFKPIISFYTVLSFSWIYIFMFMDIGVKIWIAINNQKNLADFKQNIKLIEKNEKAFINKKIIKNIDIDWHKNNNFNINAYSSYAKEIYKRTKK